MERHTRKCRNNWVITIERTTKLHREIIVSTDAGIDPGIVEGRW
jgi:hypothetical protein